MFKLFAAVLAIAALGGASMSNIDTASAADIASGTESEIVSEMEPTRTILVARCKINGRWRPGRCPRGTAVNCVHHRTGKFRHAGRCRTPSR